jgi:hypothetical protein
MKLAYLIMAISGLGLVGCGLPAAHRLPRPWHILAACAVVVGVAVTLIGTLLVVVPNFFKG